MSVEYLQSMRVDERGTLLIYVTGGGVSRHFAKGISHANVAHLLRTMADDLERSVAQRSAAQSGDDRGQD